MWPPWISEYDEHDYDGQMMSGDRLGLKFPDICLMETCPDRESNPGPLLERRIRYPLLRPSCSGPARRDGGEPIRDMSRVVTGKIDHGALGLYL
ncbi:hypothetical protein C0J52_05302 [Blattella germanica]|nr:hypothetical protein C0J52_05302 [Blattella germanica]